MLIIAQILMESDNWGKIDDADTLPTLRAYHSFKNV